MKEREKFRVEARLVELRVRMCFHREIILPPMTGRHATRRETLASIAAHQVNLHTNNQHLLSRGNFCGGVGEEGGRVNVILLEEFSASHESDANDCACCDNSIKTEEEEERVAERPGNIGHENDGEGVEEENNICCDVQCRRGNHLYVPFTSRVLYKLACGFSFARRLGLGGLEPSVSVTNSFGGHDAKKIITTEIKEITI